jgi:hypothetical protein
MLLMFMPRSVYIAYVHGSYNVKIAYIESETISIVC